MAFPKKGFRKITDEDHTFLWKVRKKSSHNEKHNVPISIPIQFIDGGQVLLATIAYARSEYGEYAMTEITPSLITKCIQKAIAEGWNFKENGKPYKLDCIELCQL